MGNKHLTYDDRLAIQAGLQVAQIAKIIGKDRSTVGEESKSHKELVSTSKGNNCTTIVPASRSRTVVQAALVERSSSK